MGGYRIQKIQRDYGITVNVTKQRTHFPGSNNKGVLLFNGPLVYILLALRELYVSMKEEACRTFFEGLEIPADKLKVYISAMIERRAQLYSWIVDAFSNIKFKPLTECVVCFLP